MLKHPELTEKRIEQFIGMFLEPRLEVESAPLALAFNPAAANSRKEAAKGKWVSVAPGFRWGPAWRTVWFKASGTIPSSWEGKEVVARLEVGGERTIWKGDSPGWGIDGPHDSFPVTKVARGGEAVEIWIQAYGDNPAVRVHGHTPEPEPKPFAVSDVSMRVFDRELWDFYLDCKFYHGLLVTFDKGDAAGAHVLRGLNEAVNRFDPHNRETLQDARRALREWTVSRRTDRYHTLTPVGHAHLDTAWLWPIHITKKKMAHTTSTQLALMDSYPEYVYVHSQASQYEWLESEHPELFRRVREKVVAGQWEPLGSMWVEADTNLAGGEALVRQFLYGKRYFKEKFGIETKDMWLPDVFGYSAAIPQMLNKLGIDYFLTQKISWNQINIFPHNTFWWQGIDGSRIWSHFPPADTYCGMCTPIELKRHLTGHRDPARSDHGLYVYGYGDGGGGPTAEHIEFLRRAARAPGLPQIQSRRAAEFFQEARDKSRDLPVWAGELYLEAHRGTYTTQAANKKLNRHCEFLMRDIEFLSVLRKEFPRGYPAKEIERLWKLVLLNQFHDILPGSSVREVYDDSDRDYKDVVDQANAIAQECLSSISEACSTTGMERPIALFKFAEVSTEGRLPLTGKAVPQSLQCDGENLPVQEIDEFGERHLIFPIPERALGFVAICDLRTEAAASKPRLAARARRIENDTWSVRFDPHGNVTSILSLEDQTEYIEQGKVANCLQLFDDRPLYWSAWDVDVFALETQQDLIRSERFEVVERGPVRVAVEIEKKFGKSTLRQRISLGPTPGIRFDTWIDWREDEKMLKVAFPVNVNSPRATFEIQFGNVERPTHVNTSWDTARFEVCAHKWVDLSEGGHGVALLNDSKYGHDIRGNVIRLTLLRSPKAPDPNADMGIHRFTYALMPHFGPYNWAGVVQAAQALNAPLHSQFVRRAGGGKGECKPLLVCEDRNLIIESVKKAEASEAIIIRLYEAHNSRGSAEMACARRVKSAHLCDLMENKVANLEIHEGVVLFDYKPFEIITIMLVT